MKFIVTTLSLLMISSTIFADNIKINASKNRAPIALSYSVGETVLAPQCYSAGCTGGARAIVVAINGSVVRLKTLDDSISDVSIRRIGKMTGCNSEGYCVGDTVRTDVYRTELVLAIGFGGHLFLASDLNSESTVVWPVSRVSDPFSNI